MRIVKRCQASRSKHAFRDASAAYSLTALVVLGLAVFAVRPAEAQLRFDSEGNIIVGPDRPAGAAVPSLPWAAVPATPQVTPPPTTTQPKQPRIAFPALPKPKGQALERTRTHWSYADLLQAQSHCLAIAKKHNVTFTPLQPIKRGACGDPQPVRLDAIGGSDGVTFDPPATVNCAMVAALAVWVRKDLQKVARKHLGKRVTRINVMSDYACRNVYGRRNARLSQHAKANALDIRGFAFADGAQATLLAHWGPTRRRLRAIARAQATKTAADRAKRKQRDEPNTNSTSKRPNASPGPVDSEAAPAPDARVAEQLQSGRGTVSPHADDEKRKPARRAFSFSFGGAALPSIDPSQAFKLGGPKQRSAARPPGGSAKRSPRWRKGGSPVLRKRRFLKAAFRTACRRFGTVLGPEFDNTHTNHFHFDLAVRRHANYCR